MDLTTGRALAEELMEITKDYTTRIEVAGGIRREKAYPHDIELVAIPRYEPAVNGLFGRESGLETNLLDSWMTKLLKKEVIDHGPPDVGGRKAPFSEKLYRFRFEGETIDLFVVTKPAEWGPIFACRTGDASFTQHVVTYAHPMGIRFSDGRILQHVDARGVPVPIATKHDHRGCKLVHLPAPEEADVFRIVGIEYLEPRKRETGKEMKVD